MMLPAQVYPTWNSPAQTPAPDAAGFVAYLHEAVGAGAIINDEKSISVGGQSATILTLTGKPDVDLDGLLGCPNTAAAAADCYGPSADELLRVAVLEVHGKLLLIWARNDDGVNAAATFFAAFESMLTGLKFR